MREGTYKPTPIESAKTSLEKMGDPEVGAAYWDAELGKQLKPENRKILANFVYHLKMRRRKDGVEEIKR